MSTNEGSWQGQAWSLELAQLTAWHYGVDLAGAGRPWVAVVASPKRIRAELPEGAMEVREIVGHDSFAHWIHLGYEDAAGVRRSVDRGMDL